MTFVVSIRPRPPFGTDKEELLVLGNGLAQEIGKLPNIRGAECSEVIEKSLTTEPSVVITALFTGLLTNVAYDALKALVGLLKKKLRKREFEAYSFEINRTYYHLSLETLSEVEGEILKQIPVSRKKTIRRAKSKAKPPAKASKTKRAPKPSDGA
ncbi:MAG: hypothetical protein WB696_10450 [Chthoniobacterales bacterium]